MLYCIQNSSYQNLFLNVILIFTLDLFANVKTHPFEHILQLLKAKNLFLNFSSVLYVYIKK